MVQKKAPPTPVFVPATLCLYSPLELLDSIKNPRILIFDEATPREVGSGCHGPRVPG